MRRAALETLRQRFGFACGYCGITEANAGAKLTVDHFRPRVAGGDDASDNLVYAWHACNECKGDFHNPASEERLLHPLREDLSAHLSLQSDGVLQGLTETGRFHITRLQLNRPTLIAHRQREQMQRQVQDDIKNVLSLLGDVVERVDALTSAVNELKRGGE